LSAKSPDRITKELLMAVTAHNVVRAVQYAGATQAGIEPRRLSFSRVQDGVNAWLPLLSSSPDPERYEREFQRMLGYAARCRLPAPLLPQSGLGAQTELPKTQGWRKIGGEKVSGIGRLRLRLLPRVASASAPPDAAD
jgi:hypothetical protein